MATYAISDIHGCFDEFQQLLDIIKPTSHDTVYILGDVCDRGPKSAETIVWCIEHAPDNFHFLLGNHDLMMRDILRRDPAEMPMRMNDDWFYNGGYETAEDLYEQTTPEWRQTRLLPYLEALKPFEIITVANQDMALVHAGFNPNTYLDKQVRIDAWAKGPDFQVGHGIGKQNELIMCWIRNGWFDNSYEAPLTTIYGHTPTKYIARLQDDTRQWLTHTGEAIPADAWYADEIIPNRIWKCANKIDIDCGCVYGGNLAALRLDDMQEFYIESTVKPE